MAMAAMGLGFIACEKVEDSDVLPQTHPQEAIFSADNLTVTDEASVNVSETPGDVKVASYSATNFPKASTPAFTMQIAKTADFDKVATVDCSVDTATHSIYALGADINAAYQKVVTRNPAAGSAFVRFSASATNGTEQVIIGGPDVYFGQGSIQVTPVNDGLVIENTYTFVCGDEQIAFMHSDIDPYDDPVFKVNFEAVAGAQWQIKSAAGKTFGPAEAGLTEGALVAGATGSLTAAGPHSIEINMRDLTYKIAIAIETLYTPGNSNGWSQGASQTLTTTDYVNYYGFAHLNGEFKFTSRPDWNGINYGSTGVAGELSTDGGAGNLSASANGLYWCHVDLVKMTYEITKIETLGCIGGFNGWGAQVNLEPSDDFLVWTGEVTFSAGDEWKFRCNDDWGINLGGSLEDLVPNGDNLKQAEGGKKEVTLDLSARPYIGFVD